MSFITPTFHSIIVTDHALTADQMYIHHDQHRNEVMGKVRSSLQCTAIYPNTNVEEALDFLKRTPHHRSVKVLSNNPQSLGPLVQLVNHTVFANHQEYLQAIASINRSYED